MECPRCGYVMSEFDAECPRCKRLGEQAASGASAPPQASQPAPFPAVEPVPPSETPAKAKTSAGMIVELPTRRSDAFKWAAIGVGLAVVILLGIMVGMQLRKSPAKPTVVQTPAQNKEAATTDSGTYASLPAQNKEAATTNSEQLAAGAQQNREAATTNAEDLAAGQQQKVNPAPGGPGYAEDQEQSYDPRQVRSWREVARFSGKAGSQWTPNITVGRPWRVRYFSGTASEDDIDLGGLLPPFIVRGTQKDMSSDLTFATQPKQYGESYSSRSGTFPLQIMSLYDNWVVVVEQGEF